MGSVTVGALSGAYTTYSNKALTIGATTLATSSAPVAGTGILTLNTTPTGGAIKVGGITYNFINSTTLARSNDGGQLQCVQWGWRRQ